MNKSIKLKKDVHFLKFPENYVQNFFNKLEKENQQLRMQYLGLLIRMQDSMLKHYNNMKKTNSSQF